MITKDWLSIVQILVTIAGMYVGPKLAIRYSMKQFHSTKWWERREQLYTSLLESLSFLRYYYAEQLDAAQMQGRWNPSEADKKNYAESIERLQKSIEFGSYLLSEESAKVITAVVFAGGDSAYEYFDSKIDAVIKATGIVRNEANLNVKVS
jgi:hypothetical protein